MSEVNVRHLTVGLVLAFSTAHSQATPTSRYLTTGLFIGAIEEGARIFTPVRLLPFDHPEAVGHQFPTARQVSARGPAVLVYQR